MSTVSGDPAVRATATSTAESEDEAAVEPHASSRSYRRRAAVIASAIALPLTVILALALTAGHRSTTPVGPAPVLSVAGFPANPASDATCARILQRLPVTLSGLVTRRVSSASASVVAWGDPAVVLRCGVPRPTGLVPASADYVQEVGDGAGRSVEWLPATGKKQTVWTTIDRRVYVEVTVPGKYDGASMITPLTTAVAQATPAVCQAQPNPAPPTPVANLCVDRK